MKASYAEKRKLEELRLMNEKLDLIMAHFGLALPSGEPASPSTHVESEILPIPQSVEQLSVAGAGDENEPVVEATGKRNKK